MAPGPEMMGMASGMTPTGETDEIEYRGEKKTVYYYENRVG